MNRRSVIAAALIAAAGLAACDSSGETITQTVTASPSAPVNPSAPDWFPGELGEKYVVGEDFAPGTYRPANESCTYLVREPNGAVVTGAIVNGRVNVQLDNPGYVVESGSSCGEWRQADDRP